MKKANELYTKLMEAYPKADALYEDTIVSVVDYDGLMALRANNFIEACGLINGRKLYAM